MAKGKIERRLRGRVLWSRETGDTDRKVQGARETGETHRKRARER